MNAQLRKLWSLEIEDDLSHFTPPDTRKFGTWVRMLIGPDGEAGTESFDIFVCTPSWLEAKLGDVGAILPRHHLVVLAFDRHLVTSHLARTVSGCSGRDWSELREHLGRIGASEFEDYRGKIT